MQVRGAPLIGATAAYGLAIALEFEASDRRLAEAAALLRLTRPTAVNLHWALARMESVLQPLAPEARHQAAWQEAGAIADEDVAQNAAIGQHGLKLWKDLIVADGQTLNVMTHCNAGWLATVDWGTALSPIYAAHDAGVPVHVWVSETRPRNQGLLTAWELEHHGVPHTLIADNAAGLLMRQGRVDAVIVGADRIAANGDVANKVGTYLKALACADNGIPFYVAAPRSTIDFACPDGADIPDRGARRRRIPFRPRPRHPRPALGAAPVAGRRGCRQPGFRRHPRLAGHGHHHRTRRLRGQPRRPAGALSGRKR